jgi:nucleotide-binding universal stress UspA family protein
MHFMRKIVVPVSFAANARAAARYAADVALAIGAELDLVHVVQGPHAYARQSMPGFLFEELRDSGYLLLQDLSLELVRRTGGKIRVGTTLEIGEVADKLKVACARLHPFLVVMGTGGNGANAGLDASQTLRAMHNLPYPVLAVPPDAIFHGIHQIAIACDREDIYSGVSPMLPFLRELNRLLEAKLEVVHVVVSGQSIGETTREYSGWKKVMDAFGDQLHVVREDAVEQGVQDFLQKHPVDWLLVLPKKHAFLEFHKSKSKEIVLRSPVPVMSVHE